MLLNATCSSPQVDPLPLTNSTQVNLQIPTLQDLDVHDFTTQTNRPACSQARRRKKRNDTPLEVITKIYSPGARKQSVPALNITSATGNQFKLRKKFKSPEPFQPQIYDPKIIMYRARDMVVPEIIPRPCTVQRTSPKRLKRKRKIKMATFYPPVYKPM